MHSHSHTAPRCRVESTPSGGLVTCPIQSWTVQPLATYGVLPSFLVVVWNEVQGRGVKASSMSSVADVWDAYVPLRAHSLKDVPCQINFITIMRAAGFISPVIDDLHKVRRPDVGSVRATACITLTATHSASSAAAHQHSAKQQQYTATAEQGPAQGVSTSSLM